MSKNYYTNPGTMKIIDPDLLLDDDRLPDGLRAIGSESIIDLERKIAAVQPDHRVSEVYTRVITSEKIGPICHHREQYFVWIAPR